MALKIINEFEGAMIGNSRIDKDAVYLKLKEDELTQGYTKKFNYNHHFHFGISSEDDKIRNLSFHIGCDNGLDLKEPFKRIWISNNIDDEYEMVEISGKMSIPGNYFFQLSMKPNRKYFIANFSPIRYSWMKDRIDFLSKEIGAKENKIGKTVENRDILSYELGDIENKPNVMIVSGYHPPEMEPISIISIMERFLDKKWKEEMLEQFSFSFIPFLNPDGFSHMKQGSNVNDINFHWRFFGNTKEECPEAFHIWNYCKGVKPVFFMDFHVFTFQNNNARPYVISPWYYSSRLSRKILKEINSSFIDLCNGKGSMSEKILAPNILSSRLRMEFGTIISPKFHLHIKDGRHETMELAKKAFVKVLMILRNNSVKSKEMILLEPHGDVKSNVSFRMRMAISDVINFKLKPKLHW